MRSAEEGVDLLQHLGDGDGGQAFLLFDDAGFEVAAPAVRLVVEDAVLRAVGEPDARLVARRKDSHARGLDGGSKMHGAAVVSEEEACMGEDSGALARGEAAAEVEDGARSGVLPPALGGEVAGFALVGASEQDKGVLRVWPGERGEESAPVLAAPVFRLALGADAYRYDRLAGSGTESFGGTGVLGGSQAEVPACRVVEARFA